MDSNTADALSAVRELLELAREFRARRVRCGDLEVELLPEALPPALPAPGGDRLQPVERPQGYYDPTLWRGGTPPSFPQK